MLYIFFGILCASITILLLSNADTLISSLQSIEMPQIFHKKEEKRQSPPSVLGAFGKETQHICTICHTKFYLSESVDKTRILCPHCHHSVSGWSKKVSKHLHRHK